MGDPSRPDATLRIVKLIGGGRGLAHHDGGTWMVAGALPGELIVARQIRRRGRIVEAETVEVVADAHPARLDDPCPHRDECGGCDWPHVDTEAGAQLKIDVAAEAARSRGGVERQLRSTEITTSPASYRLRARLHWDPSSRRLGFYDRGSWRVALIDHCRVLSPGLAAVARDLRPVLVERCSQHVDLELLEGDDVVVAALRAARNGPDTMPASWIPTVDETSGLAGFHRLEREAVCRPGWGVDEVRMQLPVELAVPIGSFFQGNRHLLRLFFDRVGALIGPGDEPVIDLHAGVGFLAAAAMAVGRSKLVAVEPHPGAAAAAQRNLPQATISTGTAEAFLERSVLPPPSATAIVDPPRTGMSKQLRRQIGSWRPSRILSIGCDPASWHRDVTELMGFGYELTHLEMLDLFPSTHHVEILALLERG